MSEELNLWIKIISNNKNTEILKLHELETLRELMVYSSDIED
jgi:hypothetical protein